MFASYSNCLLFFIDYSEHKNSYCSANWGKDWGGRTANIPGGLNACKKKCDASPTCKAFTFGKHGGVPNNCALCDSAKIGSADWGPNNGPDTYVKPKKGTVVYKNIYYTL